MARNPTPIASSLYRQVRLTYTEEAGGRINYSIHVKPLNKGWNEHHCVVRDSFKTGEPCTSLEDVFLRLEMIIKEQRLPGID